MNIFNKLPKYITHGSSLPPSLSMYDNPLNPVMFSEAERDSTPTLKSTGEFVCHLGSV